MRHIVLDTETTGLNFAQGHRIVEIGCVELDHFLPTGRTFHTYINPNRLMDAGATQVSGITDSMLVGQPAFSDIVEDFLNFLNNSVLVIHNAAFDIGFLNGELGLLGMKPLLMDQTIDTVRMARQKFPGSPANLDALCRRFDIDLSARVKHGALLDAQLLAEVFLHLSGGRQPDLVLKSTRDNKTLSGENVSSYTRTFTEPRVAMLAFGEQSDIVLAHRTFLNNIKDPVWSRYE